MRFCNGHFVIYVERNALPLWREIYIECNDAGVKICLLRLVFWVKTLRYQ